MTKVAIKTLNGHPLVDTEARQMLKEATGGVKTVNGVEPDEDGNVTIDTVDETARTAASKAAEEAKANGEKINQKTGNYITPEDFGAKGNWADDSAAIQACLDYAKTNLLPVRGFGRYSIGTTTIVIDGRFQDVYLHALTYTGTGYAVQVQCAYSDIEIDTINATNGGGINVVNAGSQLPLFNTVKNTSITSVSHCIHIGNTDGETTSTIGYSAWSTSRLTSQEGSCIKMLNLLGGESKFAGNCGALESPNSYAFWLQDAGTVTIDNYSIEDGCRSGFYVAGGTRARAGYNRTRECMDKKRIDSGDKGMMLTLAGRATFRSYDTPVDVTCIDVSAADDPILYKGIMNGDEYMSYVRADRYCNANYYGGDIHVCSFDVPGYVRMTGERKFVDYGGHQVYISADADLDLREWSVLPPTSIDVHADVTYILNDAYCARGLHEITIDQTHGYCIIIKDYQETIIFDGVAAGAGEYVLRCIPAGVEDPDSSWIYNREFDTWRATKMQNPAGQFETIETITLEAEESSIIRTAEPDGRPYAFGSIIVHMSVPETSGISTSNCVAYCGDGTDDYYGKLAISGGIKASGGSVWGGLFDFCGVLINLSGTGQTWEPSNAFVGNRIPKRAKTLRRIAMTPAQGNFPAGTVVTIMATRKMEVTT